MPDMTAPKVNWDQMLTVTARRGDIAAATLALGHANNLNDEAEAFRQSLNSALASPAQESANEELTMIALALKNQGIEQVTPERGVELLIERLYAQRGAVERLRERLYGEATKDRLRTLLKDEGWTYLTPNSINNVLDMVTRAAFPSEAELVRAIDHGREYITTDGKPVPSDSQGDQERCGGSPGKPAWRTVRAGGITFANGPCLGCPDCNPAPTDQDQCTCDAASDAPSLRWHQPTCPLSRNPDDPAPTQVEGDEDCEECNGHGYIRTDYPGLEDYGVDPESEPCVACNGTGKKQDYPLDTGFA